MAHHFKSENYSHLLLGKIHYQQDLEKPVSAPSKETSTGREYMERGNDKDCKSTLK